MKDNYIKANKESVTRDENLTINSRGNFTAEFTKGANKGNTPKPQDIKDMLARKFLAYLKHKEFCSVYKNK